jgi:hypothetical protein
VVTAIGDSGVAVRIDSVQEWELGQFVADRLSQGRIFLAGDAAHVMPPFAALGASTGIQDTHNLAWKLAHVISGAAAPALLDSYHAERHPAAWLAARHSAAHSLNLNDEHGTDADGIRLADPLALVLGFQYQAGAVIGDGSRAVLDRLDLHGQPGTRLPHRWLAPGRSTLDLAGRQLTLISRAGADGQAWADAAAAVTGLAVARVPLPDWPGLVGTAADGALLVRPDQVVAWRHHGRAEDPSAELSAVRAALRAAACPPPAARRNARAARPAGLLDSPA